MMQYGTQRISNETVSVYQGYSPWINFTSDPLQSFEPMDVIDQREADLYSMWHMVCVVDAVCIKFGSSLGFRY